MAHDSPDIRRCESIEIWGCLHLLILLCRKNFKARMFNREGIRYDKEAVVEIKKFIEAHPILMNILTHPLYRMRDLPGYIAEYMLMNCHGEKFYEQDQSNVALVSAEYIHNLEQTSVRNDLFSTDFPHYYEASAMRNLMRTESMIPDYQ